MKKILLAEDEEHILDAIKLNLELEGFAVSVCINGTGAVSLAKKQPFDLIILDVMLPGIDGFEACRQIKQVHPQTPVLFLTALSDSQNRIKGLKLADDYLPKPFNLEELILRVKNLIKRAPQELQLDVFSFDKFKPHKKHHSRSHSKIFYEVVLSASTTSKTTSGSARRMRSKRLWTSTSWNAPASTSATTPCGSPTWRTWETNTILICKTTSL